MASYTYPFTALVAATADTTSAVLLGEPAAPPHSPSAPLRYVTADDSDTIGLITHLTADHGAVIAHGYTSWDGRLFAQVGPPLLDFSAQASTGQGRADGWQIHGLLCSTDASPATLYARLEVGHPHSHPAQASTAAQVAHRYRALRVGFGGWRYWPVSLHWLSAVPTPAEETLLAVFAHYWLAAAATDRTQLHAHLTDPARSTAPRIQLQCHGPRLWSASRPEHGPEPVVGYGTLEEVLTNLSPAWATYRDRGLGSFPL